MVIRQQNNPRMMNCTCINDLLLVNANTRMCTWGRKGGERRIGLSCLHSVVYFTNDHPSDIIVFSLVAVLPLYADMRRLLAANAACVHCLPSVVAFIEEFKLKDYASKIHSLPCDDGVESFRTLTEAVRPFHPLLPQRTL